MSTRARFFCENCHTEVRPNDKVCPSCGRFFGAVRCPRCTFTGESELFREGCPSCGYLGGNRQGSEPDAGEGAGDGSGTRVPLEAIDPEAASPSSRTWSSRTRRSADNTPAGYRSMLPPWFYRLSIAVLSVLLALLALWFATPN